ncbi:synaptotagmin-3 isoform X2 [Euphorbia lathyris]|uniref:synaptotagmin-3 isoform X2 n=1 Tax=Euphorbia lathyris TaxID=212925 RepID=UPI003313FED4
MGFLTTLLGVLGFAFGLPIGLLLGFFLFVYSKPLNVKDPDVRPLHELDSNMLDEILPEIPLWVKCPDYERVDWLNKFLLDMWPYLDKAICATIKTTAKPIFAEYIGKYGIEAIEFKHMTLGTLPPALYGMKVYETNEKDLVMEPVMRWAGNPDIVLVLKLMSLQFTVQLVDLQIFAAPRITLKPLVPTFPCFANIEVSLMERDTIKKQVAHLYLWPQFLEIPVLDASTVAVKKPVGILHVKVVRAMKLLKADILGTSDPYVKLSLTGEKLTTKKTTVKKKNLNPEWNENFKIVVKDPQSQALQVEVFDWDKVGGHDRLGRQMVPLKALTAYDMKEFTLDLLKDTNISDPRDKKKRGQVVVELTYVPFKQDSKKSNEDSDCGSDNEEEVSISGAGLLSVIVQGAEDVEGENHNNPYALVLFRGETKKTKMIKKTRDPRWNEEFQYTLDQPPLHEKIRIEIMSKRMRFSFRSKESLGHVEINLGDVVHNGRINEKYHLIDSKHGVIHVEIRWDTV